jgi:predicted phosphoribosyltransferase
VDAGRSLAQSLLPYKARRDVIVVATTPASLSIAQGTAEVLEVPFDIFLVRAITVPGYEGVVAGAVARGAYVPHAKAVRDASISLIAFVDAAKAQEQRIERLEASYRTGPRPLTLTSATIILVDDGNSSPEDLLTAITALRRHGINEVLVVAPVERQRPC